MRLQGTDFHRHAASPLISFHGNYYKQFPCQLISPHPAFPARVALSVLVLIHGYAKHRILINNRNIETTANCLAGTVIARSGAEIIGHKERRIMATNVQASTAGNLGSSQTGTGSKLSSATTQKTIADQANSTMSQIQNQVAALAQQQKQKGLQTRDFQKNTNDVTMDNRMTARDIGTLRHDKSRLNVFSALTPGDTVDFFSFKMASKSTA